jgi:hypothetical protein
LDRSKYAADVVIIPEVVLLKFVKCVGRKLEGKKVVLERTRLLGLGKLWQPRKTKAFESMKSGR